MTSLLEQLRQKMVEDGTDELALRLCEERGHFLHPDCLCHCCLRHVHDYELGRCLRCGAEEVLYR